jgi:DNA polymerase sigma
MRAKIGINAFSSLSSAEVMSKYAAADSRVAPFIQALKLWAVRHHLLDGRTHMGSYSFTCLCLSFLQQFGIVSAKTEDGTVEEVNNLSVGQLLLYFFYYAGVALPALTNVEANLKIGELKEVNTHVYLYNLLDPETEKPVIELHRETVTGEEILNMFRKTYNEIMTGKSFVAIVEGDRASKTAPN